MLGDGLATMAAGHKGGPANTTYGENTGVLAVTKFMTHPSFKNCCLLCHYNFRFIGKFGVMLQTIPVLLWVEFL